MLRPRDHALRMERMKKGTLPKSTSRCGGGCHWSPKRCSVNGSAPVSPFVAWRTSVPSLIPQTRSAVR